jgi:heat shock 70kDa protein 4
MLLVLVDRRCMVSFSGEERFLSDAAAPHVISSYQNTISSIKRIIGRRFDDPAVQREIENFVTCKVVPVDDGASCGFEVSYDGKTHVFSPQAVMGMLLGQLKVIADASNPGSTAADVVIGVPASFTNSQRVAMLEAAQIGGINCLRLFNDNTAIALGYGFFRQAKQPFDESKPTTVLFVDVGYSQATASVVCYRDKAAKVLSCVTDGEAGGRELDLGISKFLAAEFARIHGGLDCWSNIKARIRLLQAAEKAKKTLSPYGVSEAYVNLEFLHEEKDLAVRMTEEQLESLAAPIASRIETVVRQALTNASLSPADISNVETVGGAVRVRPVKRAIATALEMPLDEATGHGLGTSLNQDEAVCRGCALQCAMLSPLFRVKDFEIVDRLPYSITLNWEADAEATAAAAASSSSSAAAEAGAEEEEDAKAETSTSLVMFHQGDSFPLTRRITFQRRRPFKIAAKYDDSNASSGDAGLGVFTVGGFPEAVTGAKPLPDGSKPHPPKVRVDFAINLHGVIEVSQAVVLVERKEEPEASPKTEADAPAKAEGEGAESAKPEEDTAAKTEEKPAAEEAPKKKKFRKVPLIVTADSAQGRLSSAALAAACSDELKMKAADEQIRRRHARRNDIESYVYKMRDEIGSSLRSFATLDEADALRADLADAEDWVCYGDGYDADFDTLTARFTQLRAKGDPITQRAWESEHREDASSRLLAATENYATVARTLDGKFAHLLDTDRDRLRSAVRTAEEWLRDLQDKQSALPLTANPVLRVADIDAKLRWLTAECDPVVNRPPPPPPSAAPPPAPAATEEAKPAADEAKPAPAAEGEEAKPNEGKEEAEPASA